MNRAMIGVVFVAGLSSSSRATAGEGPWTLRAGEHNLYVGVLSYRYDAYDTGLDTYYLPSEVIGTEITAIWTYGLLEGLELEARVPYEQVRVGNPRAGVCVMGPKHWGAPTRGLGDLALLVKTRFLDEVYAAPVTVSGIWGTRTGEAYSHTRGRLTNLGTGQTDFGGALSIGRTDVLGNGWYRVSGSLGYWYRVPHDTVSEKVPADELQYDFNATVAPAPSVSFGPALYGFSRLGGQPLYQTDISHPNGFSSLDAAQLQAGGKLGLHPPGSRGTVTLAVLRTVAARNNPADTLVIGFGVGFFMQPGAEADIALPDLLPPEG